VRRLVVGAAILGLIVGACGGERSGDELPAPPVAPTPGQDLFPIVASSEIVVGQNRLLVGLIDNNDAPVRSPKTTLNVSFIGPGNEEASSEPTMRFLWTIKQVQGLWVGEATFDTPGQWDAVIDVEGGGYDESVRTSFDVKPEGTTPAIGMKGPAVDTPTSSDVSDLPEITTDTDPNPRFYKLSIAEAMRSGKPAVIVFATPKFCTSQVCGPTLTIVKRVSEEFPDVNFVHVEPYDLDKVPDKLVPVPAVTAWGLPSEPWVFVTDDRGRVAAKYEGSVAPQELKAFLRGL
jgi:hypothetical protein